MKMKPEHYEHMRAATVPFDTDEKRAAYIAAGLSTTRYQWDLLRAAELIPWLCDTLYQYLNDSHIQTALNKIVAPLSIIGECKKVEAQQ